MQSKSLLAAVAAAFALPSLAVEAVTDAGGNVTYDLSNVYEPFLTKTDTLIWPNRNLADIFAMTATNDGGWMSSAKEADGYFYNRTADSVMVQLQADDGLCKTVRAYFTQKGNDIYGRADAAGYDSSGTKYTELPASVFYQELATSPDNGSYGSYHLQAYGDAAGEVDALPETAPTIAVNGGTLQVNLSSDVTVTNALAGTGGFLFKATANDLNRDLSYAWPSTMAATLKTNASIYDIEVLDAVLNGSWCSGRHEGMKPYWVTTNEANQSVTVQLQIKYWDTRGWWCVKAVGIEMKQSGLDVTIKALWAAYADKGQDIGTDASKWNTWEVPVVTSGSDGGYGLEIINFKVHGAPCAIVSGPKTLEKGVVADGSRVILSGSELPVHTPVVARNGGELVVNVGWRWDAGYPGYSWSAINGSKIYFVKALSSYQDTVLLDASEASVANQSVYMKNLTMRNGSQITGTKMRACLYTDASWTSEGTDECRILPLIGLCGSEERILTIDAKGSIAFLGGVTKDDGCASFRKKGTGTLRIASVPWNFTTAFRVAGGKIQAEANVTAGTFVAEDATEIAVADGVKLAFADSSAETWLIIGTDAVLNFTGDFPEGSQKVRFGTNASGLTRAQMRRIRVNGERAHLDEDGYLQAGSSGCLLILR